MATLKLIWGPMVIGLLIYACLNEERRKAYHKVARIAGIAPIGLYGAFYFWGLSHADENMAKLGFFVCWPAHLVRVATIDLFGFDNWFVVMVEFSAVGFMYAVICGTWRGLTLTRLPK